MPHVLENAEDPGPAGGTIEIHARVPGTKRLDAVRVVQDLGGRRRQLRHESPDVFAVGIITLTLVKLVKYAKIRRRVGARRGGPLPTAVVAGKNPRPPGAA